MSIQLLDVVVLRKDTKLKGVVTDIQTTAPGHPLEHRVFTVTYPNGTRQECVHYELIPLGPAVARWAVKSHA